MKVHFLAHLKDYLVIRLFGGRILYIEPSLANILQRSLLLNDTKYLIAMENRQVTLIFNVQIDVIAHIAVRCGISFKSLGWSPRKLKCPPNVHLERIEIEHHQAK